MFLINSGSKMVGYLLLLSVIGILAGLKFATFYLPVDRVRAQVDLRDLDGAPVEMEPLSNRYILFGVRVSYDDQVEDGDG